MFYIDFFKRFIWLKEKEKALFRWYSEALQTILIFAFLHQTQEVCSRAGLWPLPPPTPPQKALLGPAMVSSCLSLAWSWAWATLLHHSSALLPAGLEGVAWLIYLLFIWFFSSYFDSTTDVCDHTECWVQIL